MAPTSSATTPETSATRRILVVGGGPAAYRLVRDLHRDHPGADLITVLADEAYTPYDRVALEQLFQEPEKSLTIGDDELWQAPGITLRTGARAVSLDRARQVVTDAEGTEHPYDELVLATGSRAAVVPIPGAQQAHVFRTIDDVRGMVAEMAELTQRLGRAPKAVVVGGGLLGLEAAEGLKHLGAEPTVIDVASWLLSIELDEGGGHAVNQQIRAAGIGVACGEFISSVNTDAEGHVCSVSLADSLGDEAQVHDIDAEIVVFAAGIRPNDELARDTGLEIGPRGGVVVDDACRTTDPHIHAVGEVACVLGRTWGLVAPANAMADAVAANLHLAPGREPERVEEFDIATKLKFSGVEVGGFGDRRGQAEGALEILYSDPARGIYQKVVTTADAKTLLGGVFVGDAAPFDALRPLLGRELPADPGAYLTAAGGDGMPETEAPDDAVLCSCNNVSFGTVRQAVEDGHQDVPAIKKCTMAGTQCGSCVAVIQKTLERKMQSMGLTVSQALCEHFDLSRRELFEAVRSVGTLDDFAAVHERFGKGLDGCAVCKPVVASILHSQNHSYALDQGRGTLQDTNDRNLANMQKDGTYSVIPRVPGGEITPEKLAVIAEVAQEFGLYTKITGAQRIGMYGARLEQLPRIWRKLVDAGFESGSAYGKALRNVKSCLGNNWCRFGVQDSVGLGIDLENRYRGLRSPHKFKFGVSGCNRECAEAQGKDMGLIATTNGWNMYVGGNGGSRPAHARLFAKDLQVEDVLRYVDRYMIYYIRTADKLQRTARWLEELDEEYGDGIEHLRQVLIEDSLGVCGELDAAMAEHVDRYEDEWAATLEDPQRLRRFRAFINEPEGAVEDEGARMYVLQRDQIRPATPEEIAAHEAGEDEGRVLISGAKIPMRAEAGRETVRA